MTPKIKKETKRDKVLKNISSCREDLFRASIGLDGRACIYQFLPFGSFGQDYYIPGDIFDRIVERYMKLTPKKYRKSFYASIKGGVVPTTNFSEWDERRKRQRDERIE